MKFTLSWLKEHLDTSASLDKISETLSNIGLEVESIEDKSKTLAPFKVAEILEAEKHPNADKLRVCKVNTGSEVLQIVCGAANARAGIKVVLAPIGVTIPANGLVIKKSNIRNVESNGMLCSAEELSLGEESDGIVELPSTYKVGSSYAEEAKLNDPVIEIAITPNRGDCLGVRGIARDLAAAGLGTLKKLEVKKIENKFSSPVKVSITDEKLAPFYVGRYFKNVKNADSPEWLKARLKAIGVKPISSLVDITNYITFAYGRPLHVYDAKKLSGNLAVRFAKGEKLMALNDKEYNLDSQIPVIADEKKAVAIGGIIGGKETGVSLETTEVFLEVALFDHVAIAKAGRALQIDSDARYRFERQLDSGFLINGAELASQMILEICGGEASELVKAGTEPQNKKLIQFNLDKIKTFGGVDVAEAKTKEILEKLEFSVNKKGNQFEVSVPSFRNDVNIEVDLIEEILRINGYDNIPLNPLPTRGEIQKAALTDKQKLISNIRRNLSSERGFIEAVTFSFMDSRLARDFAEVPSSLKLLNPISAELDAMRPSIIPNLISAAKNNINRGINNISLFEIGPVFSEKLNNMQQIAASGIRVGESAQKNHYKDSRNFDFYDVKADVFSCLALIMNPEKMTISRDVPKYYHPGKSGAMLLGKNVLAYFGEIHPNILKKLDIKTNISAFEIFVENIPLSTRKKTSKPKLEISNFQSVERDFAFILENKVSAEDIIKTVNKTEKDLIESVNIFDVYSGKGIEDGKKSIAFSVKIQPKDKTLTDTEINGISEKIIASVKMLGGTLRA